MNPFNFITLYNSGNVDFVLFDNFDFTNRPYHTWIEKCNHWKKKWQFETPETDNQSVINPYHFLKTFYNPFALLLQIFQSQFFHFFQQQH